MRKMSGKKLFSLDVWKPKKGKQLAERFSSGQSDENPPYFVGIAVISFAPYATFLFSWDYAIIIADKSCLLPWHQINARGALKLAFPLQESSFHASCSGFNPLCITFHSFCSFSFLFCNLPTYRLFDTFATISYHPLMILHQIVVSEKVHMLHTFMCLHRCKFT